eukprot:233761-Amphidinium_carterae.1
MRKRLAFREIDNGNRGSITQKEMLWALRRCGINVKQSTLTTLLDTRVVQCTHLNAKSTNPKRKFCLESLQSVFQELSEYQHN